MTRWNRTACIATLMTVVIWPAAMPAQAPQPIIDMHLHAAPATSQGPPPLGMCAPGVGFPALDPSQPWPKVFAEFLKAPPCANPIWSPKTDDEVMRQTLQILEKRNMIGLTGGPLLDRWRDATRTRLIPSLQFQLGPNAPSPQDVRQWFKEGRYKALAEVTNQYAGVEPSDPAFEPYLAIAEELDVPMGIHIGTGPPGAPYLGFTKYRARLHSPLLLEEVLMKHPRLRVFIMHAGWPMLEDLLALMWAHPHVHVDTGAISFALPRVEFHNYLRRIVEAGFGTRVMFGSDQMVWPGAIEVAIAGVESATFLTAEQKRNILFNNARRFLRLSEADVAALARS